MWKRIVDFMKTNEIIKSIMNDQNVNKACLAKKLSVPFQTIYDRLNQTNISIDKLQEMLSALDYKIVITPKDFTPPENCYEVESSTKEPNPKVWTKDGKVKLTPVNDEGKS